MELIDGQTEVTIHHLPLTESNYQGVITKEETRGTWDGVVDCGDYEFVAVKENFSEKRVLIRIQDVTFIDATPPKEVKED